jgi:hypothetical protein
MTSIVRSSDPYNAPGPILVLDSINEAYHVATHNDILRCNMDASPMRDFREILARLQAFRDKFEGLLASARKKAVRDRVAPGRRPTRLRELTGFGANPGNLRMFAYVPEHLPPKAPLVIALHGCTQTADEYDRGTGWSSLAERLSFAVVYIPVRCRARATCDTQPVERIGLDGCYRIVGNEECIWRFAPKSCKRRVDFQRPLLARSTCSCSPIAAAAGAASLSAASVDRGLAGLTKTAMRTARGINSCKSSSCFAVNSLFKS